jgi:hypothetical protein
MGIRDRCSFGLEMQSSMQLCRPQRTCREWLQWWQWRVYVCSCCSFSSLLSTSCSRLFPTRLLSMSLSSMGAAMFVPQENGACAPARTLCRGRAEPSKGCLLTFLRRTALTCVNRSPCFPVGISFRFVHAAAKRVQDQEKHHKRKSLDLWRIAASTWAPVY